MKVVLATNNIGKIREISELLAPFKMEILPQSMLGVTDVEETGLTFVENAIIKARHATRLTGLPAIADDSGLSVAALQGAPGIHSARYAGMEANAENNIQKLLATMVSIPDDKRQACYHCILVFLAHEKDPTPLISDGVWHGTILHEPRGIGGFGYDPIFYDPNLQQSVAELPLAHKNKISHRGQALQKLASRFREKP